MYGNELLTDVKTVLQSVTGDLVIDNENNKSGIYRDSFPNYPISEVLKGHSYIMMTNQFLILSMTGKFLLPFRSF